jgi:hypothetical protein
MHLAFEGPRKFGLWKRLGTTFCENVVVRLGVQWESDTAGTKGKADGGPDAGTRGLVIRDTERCRSARLFGAAPHRPLHMSLEVDQGRRPERVSPRPDNR